MGAEVKGVIRTKGVYGAQQTAELVGAFNEGDLAALLTQKERCGDARHASAYYDCFMGHGSAQT